MYICVPLYAHIWVGNHYSLYEDELDAVAIKKEMISTWKLSHFNVSFIGLKFLMQNMTNNVSMATPQVSHNDLYIRCPSSIRDQLGLGAPTRLGQSLDYVPLLD